MSPVQLSFIGIVFLVSTIAAHVYGNHPGRQKDGEGR
jgi:hypothetical protein